MADSRSQSGLFADGKSRNQAAGVDGPRRREKRDRWRVVQLRDGWHLGRVSEERARAEVRDVSSDEMGIGASG